MNIVLILLIIIGILKSISLFIMFIIECYQKIKRKDYIQIDKEYGIFYKESNFYITPNVQVTKLSESVEIIIDFLKWEYYACYELHFAKDDKL